MLDTKSERNSDFINWDFINLEEWKKGEVRKKAAIYIKSSAKQGGE